MSINHNTHDNMQGQGHDNMRGQAGKILVTGAARRIGAALVLALAEGGWHVVLHFHRHETEARQLQTQITEQGGRVELVRADLSHAQGVTTLLAGATKTGPLTALINNASLFDYDDKDSVSYEGIARHMAVNLSAPALLTKGLFDQLDKQAGKKGVVVNMLDAKLFGLNPDYYSYTLSKAACASLTSLSAQAYAPYLRVNAIAPGITLPSAGQSEAEFQKSHRRNLLQRGADCTQIIASLNLLLSSPSMTGETIILDGGAHLCPPARDVAFL